MRKSKNEEELHHDLSFAADDQNIVQQHSNAVQINTEQTVAVTKPFIQEDFVEALYKPHTVTTLCLLVTTLVFFVFFSGPDDVSSVAQLETNVKRGVLAMIFVFLVYSAVQFRDGILLRPHPAVWRVVTGMGLIYWLFCVFVLFLSREQARYFLKFFYPELGKQLPERSYAADCRVYTPEHPTSRFGNIQDTLYDEFVLAHTIGYIAKALVFRDAKLCWMISIGFELAEITFQHWLENFKECWWDHIIMDVFVCNALGIYIGLKLCDWLSIRKYPNWIGLSKIETTQGKIHRIVAQFTPYEWKSYNWQWLHSPMRFMCCLGIVLAMMIVELNAFFLKYILWIPPTNMLNVYRLLLWFAIALPAVRELYQYMSDPTCTRLGNNTWLAGAIVSTEGLICYKFSSDLFVAKMPSYIFIPWIISLSLLSVWFCLYYFVVPMHVRQKNRIIALLLNVLFASVFVPLAALYVMGSPDLQFGRATFELYMSKWFKL